jgi:hypothetical protein
VQDPAHGYTGSRHDITYHEEYICLSKEALRRLESTELPGRMQTSEVCGQRYWSSRGRTKKCRSPDYSFHAYPVSDQ